MRLLILVLMIALLPLRGWAGNVMATEMAAQLPQKAEAQALVPTDGQASFTTNLIAASARDTGATGTFELKTASRHASAMSPDCLEHMSGAGDAPADAGCGDCAVCQMCHILALAAAALVAPISLHASVSAPSVTIPFSSAEAALGQKPPIS